MVVKKTAPPAPRWISKLAQGQYKFLARELDAAGVLGVVDQIALGRYCEMVCLWRECNADIAKNGQVLEVPIMDKQGEIVGYNRVANPSVSQLLKYSGELLRLEGNFGLTPSARVGLGVNAPQETNPLDEFTKRLAELKEKRAAQK